MLGSKYAIKIQFLVMDDLHGMLNTQVVYQIKHLLM